jgi:hypothetical protein
MLSNTCESQLRGGNITFLTLTYWLKIINFIFMLRLCDFGCYGVTSQWENLALTSKHIHPLDEAKRKSEGQRKGGFISSHLGVD